MSSISIACSIIGGLVSCFFGFKLQKFVFSVIYFIFGFILTGLVLSGMDNQSLLLFIEVAVGFLFAFASLSIQKLNVFIVLFLAAVDFFSTHFQSVWYIYLMGVVVGVLLGLLSIKYFEKMIIFSTAVTGASLIEKVMAESFSLNNVLLFIIYVTIAVLGMMFQYNMNKKQINENNS